MLADALRYTFIVGLILLAPFVAVLALRGILPGTGKRSRVSQQGFEPILLQKVKPESEEDKNEHD